VQDLESLIGQALEQPNDRSPERDRFARSIAASLGREFRTSVLCLTHTEGGYSSMHQLILATDSEGLPIRAWPSKKFQHPPESTHWGLSIHLSTRGPLFCFQPLRYKRQKQAPWRRASRNTETLDGLAQRVQAFLERQHSLAVIPAATLERLVPGRTTALDDRWGTVHDILFSEF